MLGPELDGQQQFCCSFLAKVSQVQPRSHVGGDHTKMQDVLGEGCILESRYYRGTLWKFGKVPGGQTQWRTWGLVQSRAWLFLSKCSRKDEGREEGRQGVAGGPLPSERREHRLEPGQWFSTPARTPVGSENGGRLRVQAGGFGLDPSGPSEATEQF